MEVAVDPSIPTYSGGLGVMAGDLLRSAADMRVPLVGVTLLHHRGYFKQELDAAGNQSECVESWSPEKVLESLPSRISVRIEGREVRVKAWRYLIGGESDYEIPVYFLDTQLPENTAQDQSLTDCLYGGDGYYRLCQEVLLGMGGVAMLGSLGHNVRLYHMNEGHSALLTLALLRRQISEGELHDVTEASIEATRQECVFTTHTPVPAGHDQFPLDLARQVLGDEWGSVLEATQCCVNGTLNMTYLALHLSRYVNGVALRHRETSRGMFPEYPIDAITNGVHAITWTSPPFRELYDRCIPEWRRDNFYLRYVTDVPLHEIQQAHAQAKRILLDEVTRRTGVQLEENVMTLGFARRATPYKRADLLFSDLDRLRGIARRVGPLQIIYGGKAHPRDEGGKSIIRRIFEATSAMKDVVTAVYLKNYDMEMGQRICAGVDLWLNTPLRPLEASGTSGMKAALNGVPSLSVLDGWWIEGHVEGVTGWSIGDGEETDGNDRAEIESLYYKLEQVILPMFYGRPHAYAKLMRSAIALNGSFFNTQRMLFQYQKNAYFPAGE
jgi:starch phosphorylase